MKFEDYFTLLKQAQGQQLIDECGLYGQYPVLVQCPWSLLSKKPKVVESDLRSILGYLEQSDYQLMHSRKSMPHLSDNMFLFNCPQGEYVVGVNGFANAYSMTGYGPRPPTPEEAQHRSRQEDSFNATIIFELGNKATNPELFIDTHRGRERYQVIVNNVVDTLTFFQDNDLPFCIPKTGNREYRNPSRIVYFPEECPKLPPC